MASRGNNSGGDSGGRNKMLAIVAVALLGAAGAWLYFGRGPNLEQVVREQVTEKAAANPAPPPAPAEESNVATPEEKTAEAATDSGESTEEAPADGTPVKKKPLQAKAGRSVK